MIQRQSFVNPELAPFTKQKNIIDANHQMIDEKKDVKRPQMPQCIMFDTVRPIGYNSRRSIQTYTPTGKKSIYNPGNTVKFLINGKQGFWDPYSCHIDVTVELNDPLNVLGEDGLLQLDGSAQSLIQRMSVRSRGKELEDIQDYDVFCNLMYDLNMGVEARKSCGSQGVGWNKAGITGSMRNSWGDRGMAQMTDIQPPEDYTQRNNFAYPSLNGVYALDGYDQTDMITNAIAMANSQKSSTITDDLKKSMFTKEQGSRFEQMTSELDYKLHSGTADLVPSPDGSGLWDIEGQQNHPRLKKSHLNYSTSFSNSSKEPRMGNIPQNITLDGKCIKQKVTSLNFTFPLQSGVLGVLMPQSSYKLIPMNGIKDLEISLQINPYAFFSSGYRSMRDNWGQQQYDAEDENGVFPEMMYNPTAMSQTVLINNIPLTSNQVDPANQWGEPGEYLPKDKNRKTYQRKLWKITKLQLHVEQIDFGEVVQNEIDRQLLSPSGIVLHSSSIAEGVKNEIAPSTPPHGYYQIDQGFESLRSLFVCFITRDHEKYDYCRKQFRLSHNISSFQIRCGTEQIPQSPVIGNGGNATCDTKDTLNVRGNNSDFIYNLKKATGKQNEVAFEMFIDNANFAINDRCYNPAAVGAFSCWKKFPKDVTFGANMFIQSQSSYKDNQIINMHTTMGLPLFYENKHVGKAVYGLDLESLSETDNLITGINTINRTPYQIILKSWGRNEDGSKDISFNRKSYMIVYHYYVILIVMSSLGIEALGKV